MLAIIAAFPGGFDGLQGVRATGATIGDGAFRAMQGGNGALGQMPGSVYI